MIGFFDSGIGGLTVVKEIFKEMPKYQIIYFGDTLRLPYGTKGELAVKKFSEEIVNWLIKKDAKIVVVACHTASCIASDHLRRKFNIPIFEMITPTINEILKFPENKKIAIIGTPNTIKSGIYEKKLLKKNKKLKIFSLSCPLFVPLTEEGWINDQETKLIIKKYLKSLKNIDVLVLACTHYPLLEKEIRKIVGKNVRIINPAKVLAKELKDFIKKNTDLKKGKRHQFFFSDTPYNFEKISHLIFKEKIKIKITNSNEL